MRITNQNECAQHVCLICAFSWADSFPICFRSHLMPCRQIYYIPTIQKSVKTHSTSSLSYKDSHQNFLFFTSTAHEIPNNGKVLLSDFSFKNTLCFSIIFCAWFRHFSFFLIFTLISTTKNVINNKCPFFLFCSHLCHNVRALNAFDKMIVDGVNNTFEETAKLFLFDQSNLQLFVSLLSFIVLFSFLLIFPFLLSILVFFHLLFFLFDENPSFKLSLNSSIYKFNWMNC